MRTKGRQSGSVLLVVVVLVALLAVTVMGHLQVNAEEIQLMQNHLHGAQALAVAEAGLNDALAHLRTDPGWTRGFAGKPFPGPGGPLWGRGGSYTVTLKDATIASLATTSDGFAARIEADVTIAPEGPPYVVRIDELRINP